MNEKTPVETVIKEIVIIILIMIRNKEGETIVRYHWSLGLSKLINSVISIFNNHIVSSSQQSIKSGDCKLLFFFLLVVCQ